MKVNRASGFVGGKRVLLSSTWQYVSDSYSTGSNCYSIGNENTLSCSFWASGRVLFYFISDFLQDEAGVYGKPTILSQV